MLDSSLPEMARRAFDAVADIKAEGERICVAHGLQNIAHAGVNSIPTALSTEGERCIENLLALGVLARHGESYAFAANDSVRKAVLDATIAPNGKFE